ncbi:hypothetical protein THIOSC13_370018 [uncultured Thiomicrorhabdus sp.]
MVGYCGGIGDCSLWCVVVDRMYRIVGWLVLVWSESVGDVGR